MNEEQVKPVCPDCNCILYKVEDGWIDGWECKECHITRRG